MESPKKFCLKWVRSYYLLILAEKCGEPSPINLIWCVWRCTTKLVSYGNWTFRKRVLKFQSEKKKQLYDAADCVVDFLSEEEACPHLHYNTNVHVLNLFSWFSAEFCNLKIQIYIYGWVDAFQSKQFPSDVGGIEFSCQHLTLVASFQPEKGRTILHWKEYKMLKYGLLARERYSHSLSSR